MWNLVRKQLDEMASTCLNASGYWLHARSSKPEGPQVSKPWASQCKLCFKGRHTLGTRLGAVAGVDFGTTHSTISVILNHEVTAVPVAESGSVLLPSTVCYSAGAGTS